MISKEEAIAKAEKTFNTAADYFDAPALSFWNRFGQKTVDRLSLNAGDRVLDVCCGSGASAIPAAESVGSTGYVLGIDLAQKLLDLGRIKAKQKDLNNIEFKVGDFQNLGLPNQSFDAIVCVFGIFFVPDMLSGVKELWRMVRPGGKLAITSWGSKVFEPANRVFWANIETERPDLYKKFTPWDRISDRTSLYALLESAELTQIEVAEETNIHTLNSPEDWWTMVMGGGMRGTIEQLDPLAKERIKQKNLQFLQENKITLLEADVLYAKATKRC
jgi:ubiquinone/menaquinone biosynthesis C-methylase UbiE